MKKRPTPFITLLLTLALIQAACSLTAGPEMLTPSPTRGVDIEPLSTFQPTRAGLPDLSTATPALPKPDLSRSALTTQADGSTLFTDFKGGYSLAFAPNWTLLRINEQEYSDLMINQGVTDSLLQIYLMAYRQRDGEAFRLIAFDLEKRIEGTDYLTNIEVYLDESEIITIKQARLNLEKSKQQETRLVELLTSKDIVTNSGYNVGIYRAILETRAVTTQKSTIYNSVAIFTPYDSELLVISLGAPVELRADVEAFMDAVIESYRPYPPGN